jgi:hypothetical protein
MSVSVLSAAAQATLMLDCLCMVDLYLQVKQPTSYSWNAAMLNLNSRRKLSVTTKESRGRKIFQIGATDLIWPEAAAAAPPRLTLKN